MGNIILDDPVKEVSVNGKAHSINWGFKTGIRMDIAFHDRKLSEKERIYVMLKLFYYRIPDSIEEAIGKMLWYYTRGAFDPSRKQETQQGPVGRRPKREFCFNQDADIINAAFLSEYGIHLNRLSDTDMSWWEFMSLFTGLPEETTIKKYIYYRTCDITDMSKEEQKRIKKIRTSIRVKETVKKAEMSNAARLDERNRAWLNRVKMLTMTE